MFLENTNIFPAADFKIILFANDACLIFQHSDPENLNNVINK